MALNLGVTSCQSLEISLDQFVRGEVLEGSNAYYCEKCKEKVWTMPSTCPFTKKYEIICIYNVHMCLPENHSEEDVHQISAQRSVHSPHALWFRLGKRTLHQIR